MTLSTRKMLLLSPFSLVFLASIPKANVGLGLVCLGGFDSDRIEPLHIVNFDLWQMVIPVCGCRITTASNSCVNELS